MRHACAGTLKQNLMCSGKANGEGAHFQVWIYSKVRA
jgi:hypothetical protein